MKKIGEKFFYDNKEYIVERLLGEGKSGYSYLIKGKSEEYVLKLIHDKKDPNYNFGDKLEAELYAYGVLSKLDINIPKLIYVDKKEKYLIKEYIPGDTVAELVAKERFAERDFAKIFETSEYLKNHNINLDYFPFNFVKHRERLYYIDYECNNYMDEWNFENWGIYYWLNSKGIRGFIENNRDHSYINIENTAKPIKIGYEEKVEALKRRYMKGQNIKYKKIFSTEKEELK